jgi:polar amino acid transport system substrate-binding protein
MLDRPNFNAVAREDDKLEAIKVPEYSVEIGFGFQKTTEGYDLQAKMNALLEEKKQDGTLDQLIDKWYGETEPDYIVPLENLNKNTTKLKIAIDTTRKPYVYLGKDSKPAGFEIEMLYLFCEKYGYGITYEDISFATGITGLATGTYDIVCGGLYMTDEREQSVNFSNPYMVADVVMVKYTKTAFENFFAGIAEGFEKTFITDKRGLLILEGFGITLLISVCAAIGGTGLGFGLYMLSRSKNKVLSKITKGFNKVYGAIIAGTPVVVILMILYFVVFGSTDLNGIIVAIIGFILIFGSFVYKHLGLTVDGVDRGQTEAAYALGYSRNKSFFKIVLPQALRMFIPTYTGEIISLIKNGNVEKIVFDLTDCDFIDSAALGMFVIAHDEASSKAVRLSIKGAQGKVKEVMYAARFDSLYIFE